MTVWLLIHSSLEELNDTVTMKWRIFREMFKRVQISIVLTAFILSPCLLLTSGCKSRQSGMDRQKLIEFGMRYTEAWCSQNAASVASFFAANCSLQINDGEPSVGRAAITEAAQGFMAAFPDMVVEMDSLVVKGVGQAEYHWTLTGTNTGPGGTGKALRISGYEEWTLSPDGLIAESKGHFDAGDYQRQLEHGPPE